MNGTSKIELDTFNTVGEKYHISTTAIDLLSDWYNDCNMCPENDAKVEKLKIDDKEFNDSIDFLNLMRVLGKMKLIAKNIVWDAGEDVMLPTSVEVPVVIGNRLSRAVDAAVNELSDEYGYYVREFDVDWEDIEVDFSVPTKTKRSVTAYPYATVWGEIEIPDDVKDVRQYVKDHWDEIKFGEPDLDYVGTDFEVSD